MEASTENGGETHATPVPPPADPLPAMQYGDDVVLYIDPENLSVVRLAEKGWTDNQFGKFRHEFFVGKPFGSKVMSLNNKGYVYALRLTPEFFTKTLLHRTQILYFPDISLVIHNLGLERGARVVESGGVTRHRQLLDDLLAGRGSGDGRQSLFVRVQQGTVRGRPGCLPETGRQTGRVGSAGSTTETFWNSGSDARVSLTPKPTAFSWTFPDPRTPSTTPSRC